MTFQDFCDHPYSQQAGLQPMHVLALRLYTTAAYASINSPLRNVKTGEDQLAVPHGLAVTVACIAEAIRRMRAIAARREDANEEVELWRGMRDLRVAKEFLVRGGTEVAPMSTTARLEVALKYGTSTSSVLLKFKTSSFMQRGADISFLSAFPRESEILFPPLTFLEPVTTRPEKIVVDDAHDDAAQGNPTASAVYHLVEVIPHFGT